MTDTAPEAAPTLPDDVRQSFLEVVPNTPDDTEPPKVLDVGPRRISLGNDDWAMLRDPDTLRAGDRKRVLAAIPNAATNVGIGLSMTDGIAMIAIESWSLDLPLPKDDEAFRRGEGFADSLDRLTFVQERALHEALEDYRAVIFRRPKDSPSEPGTGPTVPSEGSSPS